MRQKPVTKHQSFRGKLKKSFVARPHRNGLVLYPPHPEPSLLRHFSDQASPFHPGKVPLNSSATCAC